MQLTDQVAIITGSARGIGRATALGLAREGASIVVADINAAGAQEAAAAIEGLGQQAIAVQTDVADQEQVQAMVQRAIEAFGRIDILVNNAGNAVLSPLLETTAAVWDRTLKIHLYGTFFCTQAVVQHMVTHTARPHCEYEFGLRAGGLGWACRLQCGERGDQHAHQSAGGGTRAARDSCQRDCAGRCGNRTHAGGLDAG